MGFVKLVSVVIVGGASPTTWSRLRFMSFRRLSKLVGDMWASCLGAQARVRKSRPMEAHLESVCVCV